MSDETSVPALSPNELINQRYLVVRLLGAGGMGAVYEARDQVLDKRIALKILHSEIAQDPQMNARFIQEARAASAFKHSNVVESLDFGVHQGAPFLVMEYLEGESYADLLEREQALSPRHAVELLEPIARALGRAHLAGIIHRDVKPDNVFLAREDDGATLVPKLVDFGIAKRATDNDNRLTKTSVAMGTPFYMAPEQAMGARDVTEAADQYAFAAMLYESVCGQYPHDGDSYNALIVAKVTMDAARVETIVPEISQPFADVLMKGLAKMPGDRYPTIAAFRDALVQAVQDPQAAVRPTIARQIEGDDLSLAGTQAATVGAKSAVRTGTLGVQRTGSQAAVPAHSVAGVERPSMLAQAPVAPRSNAAVVGGAALVALVMVGGGIYAFRRSPSGATVTVTAARPTEPPAPVMRHVSVRVVPSSAEITADGRVLGTGQAMLNVTSGTAVELRIAAAGHVPRTERFTVDSDQNLERVLEALPAAVQPPTVAATSPDAGAPVVATGSNRGTPRVRTHHNGLQLNHTGIVLDNSVGGH
ncbi:MAG: serine/threonine-protein kinase [Deltaproteobacteria bacterium]|nr:serine/threonine-protein kinase [Deltaproteobacteria bacterium]